MLFAMSWRMSISYARCVVRLTQELEFDWMERIRAIRLSGPAQNPSRNPVPLPGLNRADAQPNRSAEPDSDESSYVLPDAGTNHVAAYDQDGDGDHFE